MPDSKQENVEDLVSTSAWKNVEKNISNRGSGTTLRDKFSEKVQGQIYNTFSSKLLFTEKPQNISHKYHSNHDVRANWSMSDIKVLDEPIHSRECGNQLLGSTLDRLPIFLGNCGKVNMKYTERTKENLEDETTFQILSSRSSTPYTLSQVDNKIHSGLSSPEYGTPIKLCDDLREIDGSADLNFIIKGPFTTSKMAKKRPGNLYKYTKEFLEKIRWREIKRPQALTPSVLYCDNIELEVRLRKFDIFKMERGSRNVHKSNSVLRHIIGEGDIAASKNIDFQNARNKSERYALFNQSEVIPCTLGSCVPETTNKIYRNTASIGLNYASQSVETQKHFAIKRSDLTLSGLDILTVDKLEASWKQKPLSHGGRTFYNGETRENHQNPVEAQKVIKHETQKPLFNKTFSKKDTTSNISVYANDVLKVFIQELQFQEKHKNQLLRLRQQQQQAALIASLHMKTVLRRPECHLILQNLIKGEISKHGLMIHLANPSLTQRDRESITAVLTFTSESPPLQFVYNNALLKIFEQIENVPYLDHKCTKNVPVENFKFVPLTVKRNVQANLNLHNNLFKRTVL